MLTRATEAMLASASPRKPSERTCSRSSSEAILLVACRANAIGRSPLSMPAPLSATRICLIPPSASVTPISVAPASRLFSSSSLRTDAGRSTTSPAAIWLMSVSGKGRIRGTGGGLFSPGMTGALRPCRFREDSIICRGRMPRWNSFSPVGICSSISTGTSRHCSSNTAPGFIRCSSPSFFAKPGWS